VRDDSCWQVNFPAFLDCFTHIVAQASRNIYLAFFFSEAVLSLSGRAASVFEKNAVEKFKLENTSKLPRLKYI
jgi:hypothetical protein